MLFALCLAFLRVSKRGGHSSVRVLGSVIGFWMVIALLPVQDWALRPLESRFPRSMLPAAVDGIAILSGAENSEASQIRGQPVLSEAVERLTGLLALAQRYPTAQLVLSDGLENTSNQSTGQMSLRELGVNLALMETRSRNTVENAEFSYRLVKPEPGEQWVLVTSAFHMPRSVGLFRRLGWPVIPFSVDYRARPDPPLLEFRPADSLIALGVGTREWLALGGYWLLRRTDELFPAPGPFAPDRD